MVILKPWHINNYIQYTFSSYIIICAAHVGKIRKKKKKTVKDVYKLSLIQLAFLTQKLLLPGPHAVKSVVHMDSELTKDQKLSQQ